MEDFSNVLTNNPAENEQTAKADYAARKQYERESLFSLVDQVALQTARKGNNLRLFLDIQARFDHYSTTNALLILAQKWDATRLGDFDAWKKEGASIKRGEKAFSVLEPGKEYQREGGGTGQSYNIKKVFDVSQVNLPKTNVPNAENGDEPTKREPSERELLSALAAKAPIKISVADELPIGANFITDPETGAATLKKGLAFEETFGNLAVALGTYEAAKIGCVEQEFAGYCAGYVVCTKYGVDTAKFDFANAPPIFRDDDAKAAKSKLSQIREAANIVINRVERNLSAAAKSAENAAKTAGATDTAQTTAKARKDTDRDER